MINIAVRLPGNKWKQIKLPDVPRPGDMLDIEGTQHPVQSIIWIANVNSVTVYVK